MFLICLLHSHDLFHIQLSYNRYWICEMYVCMYVCMYVVAIKETGLEVNAEKTKYMVTSQDLHSGQYHNIKRGNKFFERVEQFRYLGTTHINPNSIHEEIRSRLKSGSDCSIIQCRIICLPVCYPEI